MKAWLLFSNRRHGLKVGGFFLLSFLQYIIRQATWEFLVRAHFGLGLTHVARL